MGKRGQAKKACQHCTRRKIRCDLEECKKKGGKNHQCTQCRRRKKECIEINDERRATSFEALTHSTDLDVDSNAYRSSSTIHSTPAGNVDQAEQSTSIETNGIKCLDKLTVEDAITNFFSSNCFLSRILLHWRSLLLEYINLLPSLHSTDPICLLIEAIVCYGITLNPKTASSYLPIRTALTQNLKSSLEKILMNESTDLKLRQLRDMNAILASCTILFDVWLNAGVYYPDSLLPKQSNGAPIFHDSVLRIPVINLECPTRLLEMVLFDMGGIGSNTKEDVGDCSNNLLLYWYIYLIDVFSIASPQRYPFIHQDTISLLKRKQRSFGFRKKQFQMVTAELEADKKLEAGLLKLGGLADVWWQIGSLWKFTTADQDSISYVDFREVLQSLRIWEDEQLQPSRIEVVYDQDPIEHCVLLLNKYGYLKLYTLAQESCILDRTDIESKILAYEIRIKSLEAWHEIVILMEILEKSSIEKNEAHSLLSQSRIMVSCTLDCIEWSLRRLSAKSNLEEEEKEEILKGSERLLFITNRYGNQDAFLGLDTLDPLSQMEQMVYDLRMKHKSFERP